MQALTCCVTALSILVAASTYHAIGVLTAVVACVPIGAAELACVASTPSTPGSQPSTPSASTQPGTPQASSTPAMIWALFHTPARWVLPPAIFCKVQDRGVLADALLPDDVSKRMQATFRKCLAIAVIASLLLLAETRLGALSAILQAAANAWSEARHASDNSAVTTGSRARAS
ncbi:hypothetical protein ABPG75_007409 [Micractinium tetrahymenae]